MVETNKFNRYQRSYINMVKYCGKKGKKETMIRIKCVRRKRL